MSGFICPVCGGELAENNGSLLCEKGHNYDIAKSGYVNLLMSGRSKERSHGDSRAMVRARRDFLDKGYYLPLRDALCRTVRKYAFSGMKVLDAGCGECWYTAGVAEYLEKQGISAHVCGVDVSKEALICGAKRGCGIELAVANTARLPVADGSVDAALSLFAPCPPDEMRRVLSENGVLIRVLPGERHLMGLKRAIYDVPRENDLPQTDFEGFSLVSREDVRETAVIDGAEDIEALFTMTPYYYRTGESDKAKLLSLEKLETELDFVILTYSVG